MQKLNAYLMFSALLAVGCGGVGPASGPVEVALSAATVDPHDSDVVSAVVTVREIHVQLPGDLMVPVMLSPTTVDLLKLDGKTLASLGVMQLPAGRACKLLLRVTDGYVVLKNGQKKTLDLPDGGVVKVNGDLHVEQCATGTVIVDFDPKISSENAGYALHCSAHIKTQKTHGSCGNADGGTTPAPDQGGSCTGVVCGPGETCASGVCLADPCAGVICLPAEMCSAGICVPKDPCAGVACQPNETCNNGVCVPHANPDMHPGPMDGGCKK